jgi:hypothetical protein
MNKLNIIIAAKYTLRGVDTQFNEAFQKFIEGAQAKVDAEYKDSPNLNPRLEYDDGKKFVRVKKVDVQTSAFAFIDKTNGNVLKPAGWKAPAKGARGNLFDDKNGLGRMTAYGPEYNR